MENTILQPILKAGLLDLGDSDERLKNIEKSISDLEIKLKKEQSLLPTFTLVALDPSISPEEPVLNIVEEIIVTHWKALRSKFTETPVPIIRAVILCALYNVGLSDAKIARIIYLTGSNFYPYAKLGREKEIVEKIITDLGELAEKNANEEWALNEEEPKLKISTLKLSGLQLGEVKIDSKILQAGLQTAIGNDSTGHGTQHGGGTSWGTHFSTKASTTIQKVVEEGFKTMGESVSSSSIEDPINKFFTDFKKSLDQVLKSSFSSIQSVERRSKLLWWKETLYSSELQSSYRDLNTTTQSAMMARDLYFQLPSIVPASVDYLLKDTLLLINKDADVKMKFSEYLNQLKMTENTTLFKDYFEDVDAEIRRITITDFIILVIRGKVEVSKLKQYTGIEDKAEVSLVGIAVMILHNLMAGHLIPKSK